LFCVCSYLGCSGFGRTPSGPTDHAGRVPGDWAQTYGASTSEMGRDARVQCTHSCIFATSRSRRTGCLVVRLRLKPPLQRQFTHVSPRPCTTRALTYVHVFKVIKSIPPTYEASRKSVTCHLLREVNSVVASISSWSSQLRALACCYISLRATTPQSAIRLRLCASALSSLLSMISALCFCSELSALSFCSSVW
jgi:hypothetical protein